MEAESPLTRARGDAGVPAVLRSKIEKAIESIGEVEHHKKTHKKGPGPVAARCLPPEDTRAKHTAT